VTERRFEFIPFWGFLSLLAQLVAGGAGVVGFGGAVAVDAGLHGGFDFEGDFFARGHRTVTTRAFHLGVHVPGVGKDDEIGELVDALRGNPGRGGGQRRVTALAEGSLGKTGALGFCRARMAGGAAEL